MLILVESNITQSLKANDPGLKVSHYKSRVEVSTKDWELEPI